MRQVATDFQNLSLLKFPNAPQYYSYSEYACAKALEKYVSGWTPIVGETLQVPVGKKFIDFKVGNTFIEFHPLILRREFINTHAFHTLLDSLKAVPVRHKTAILQSIAVEMKAQYFKRRRDVLNTVEEYRDCPLLVCEDADSLYDVLKIVAENPLPRRDTFTNEWFAFKKSARKLLKF